MNLSIEAESPVYTKMKEAELPSKTTRLDSLFKRNRTPVPNAPDKDQTFDTKTMKRIKKFGQGHGLGKFTEFMSIIDSLNEPKNQKTFYNQVKSFAFHEESEAVISEHGEIKGLCFSPNRQMIASATQESIRIWDSKSKKLLTSLQHQGDFDPMSIVMSDTLVLVGGVSGSIRHYRLNLSPNFALLDSHYTFHRHKGPVQVLLMTRDWQTLISGGDDGLIVIWSLIDSNIKNVINAHKSAILSLALDSKENVLVSGGEDKVIKVWNFENGKALEAFPSRGDKVLAIDVSSDGKYLAIGNSDRTLRIFDMSNGEEYATITETDPIKALVFVPQAEASDRSPHKELKKTQGLAEATKVIPKEVTLIFTTSSTLMIYDVVKKEVSSIRQGHTEPITFLSIMSDGSKVASASSDWDIRIWSLKKEGERNVLFMDDMKEIKAIRTTNDHAITGGADRQVHVWCLKTGRLLVGTGKEREMPAHKAEITAIAISHDGRLFATGDGKEFEGEVNICVKVGGSVELNDNPYVKWCPKFIAHPDSGVVALKFLKTEDNFLSLGDTCLKVWKLDTEGKKARSKSEKHLGKFKHNTMDVDAEEERVIVGNQQGQLVVYSLLDPKLGELIHINAAHSPSVVAVKFTLFGGKVISAGTDSTIKVWDFKTNPPTMLNCFQMKYFPKTIELTSDNSRVITSWDDNSIRVFEIETLKQVGIVEGVEEVSKVIALTPDQSRLLISGGSENRIKILDLSIMKTMRVLRGHYEEVSCLAISPDGKVLASGSHDFTIKIWDLTDASRTAPVTVLDGHAMNLTCLRFIPNSKNLRLVSGSLDNTIRLWESRNSKFEAGYVFKRASNAITDIAIIEFGDSGSTERTVLGIFSIGDRTIRVWDFETERDPDFGFSFPPARSPIHCLAVHKKEQKVFAGTNSKIYVYDLDDNLELEPLEGHEMPVRSLAISECSNKLFSGSEDRNIRVWNLEDFSLITTLRGHSLEITSLVVNDEGSNLFSASKDKTILMWDIQNYKRLTQFEGHNGPIQDICLSSDQKTLFSGSTDNQIRVWDLDDSAHFPFLEGHSLAINDLVMTPNGEDLISAGCDNKVIIWNFETGKQKKILRGSENEITGLALNSQGNLLFTYSNQDKNILMWDLTTSSFDVVENVSPSDCLAVESNDQFLAAGCSDSVVRVITLCPDPKIIEFEGHCGNVRSILISKDSKMLISGGNDGLIMVWNYDGKEKEALKTLSKKEKAVLCLYLSDDSKLLIAGHATGKIVIWNLETEDYERVLFPNKYNSPIRYLGMNSGYLLIGSQADLQYVDWKNRSLIKSEQLTNNKMIMFPKNEQSLYLVAAYRNELEIMELQLGKLQKEESKQEQDDDKKELVMRKILGIPEQITAETMSPNKEMLIFASNDNCIYVWHLYKSELLAHFEGHRGDITSLLVSKDNNILFSSSLDKKIGVWSISDNHLLSYLNGHSDSVMCLAFSPNEDFMFSGSNDGVVIKWNIKAMESENQSQSLGQSLGANYNFKQEKKYRIEGQKVLSLDVHPNGSYFICGGSAKTIYMIDCSDKTQNDKPVKKLILSSAIKRLIISPNGEYLVAYLENSKMLICETNKYTVIRELELKKDNFRTLPVFVTFGNNPLMLYFEKLIDVKTGEVIFDFETIEELYTFFYDARPGKEVYYYISKNFQLFHFKMSYFNDFLNNYLNYDSLTRFDDANLVCQRKQSVFPFFFSFMHLIAIFEKGEYFTEEKLKEIYEGDVKMEYFYGVDVFMNTPLDILLVKKDATLIDKYFQLFYNYFSLESTTFAQKARFLNYEFKPNYDALDLLKDLIPLCDDELSFIGSYLEKCFIDLDPTVYNNTLSFEELEEPVIIESNHFQTNDEAFLREELEKKLGKKEENKEKDSEEAKKKALIKAKIFCIPAIGNIFNPDTHDIFSRISDCKHDSEIFQNKTVSILAHHIWDSQIKFYYLIELCVFLFFFILFNINTFVIYESRLGSAETIGPEDAPVTIYYPREDSTVVTSVVIDAFILVYALFTLINEARELKNSGIGKYTKSVWNYFDVLLIPLLFCSASFDIYLSQLEFDPNPETADSLIKPFKLIFSLTMFCFWMRFISFFRAIAETSSMIRLIFTVISAVKYFVLFMVLFMGTLTATFFPLHIDDPVNPPLVWETFFAFYKSTVGDSSGITDYVIVYPNLGTFFMIISTFLFAIMLLNLLVSIIGDKHGEIQDAEEKTRLYELINILVDSNSSLTTLISKKIKSLFKKPEVGTYVIYVYNKAEEEEEDQFKNLEETTISKSDEMKNFTEGLINEKIKQLSKQMFQNTKMIKFITDCVVKQQGGLQRAEKFKTKQF